MRALHTSKLAARAAGLAFLGSLAFAALAHAATITIVNNDGVGEGGG